MLPKLFISKSIALSSATVIGSSAASLFLASLVASTKLDLSEPLKSSKSKSNDSFVLLFSLAFSIATPATAKLAAAVAATPVGENP